MSEGAFLLACVSVEGKHFLLGVGRFWWELSVNRAGDVNKLKNLVIAC